MKILCELLGVPLLISLLMYISSTQSDRSVNKKHVSSSYSYVMFKYKHANLTQSITFDHEINIFGTKLTQGHGSMKDDMKGNHNGQITKNKNLNQIIALDNDIKDLLRTNLKVSQGHGSIEDDMKMKNNGLILKNKHFNQIIALDNEVKDLLRTNLKENHDSFKPDVNLEDVENIQNRPIQEDERLCVVTVGRKTMPVSCESHIFQAPPIPENATVFKFDKIPSDPRLLPEIGNGHLATVLFSDTIYMNGLYNGANTSSHRARIPSRVSFNITGISPANSTRTRVFDMGRGVYYERYEGGGYFIEVRQYAHRLLTRLMVVEVIMRRNGSQHLSINVTVNRGPPSDDFNFKNFSFLDISMFVGKTKVAEYPNIAQTTPVTVFSNDVLDTMTLAPGLSGEVILFFTSISTSRSEAVDYWNKGMRLAISQTVFSSHVEAWTRLWERGRVELTGNLTLSRITYASQYYLLSSLPVQQDETWPFVGLSPGGLAHGGEDKDYMGHVFWDQDTWMFPPILLLHSHIGKLLVSTRIRTLSSARRYAAEKGFKGARYPWESGYTGLEVSPSYECGNREIHITGDVCLAFRQYVQQTNDTHFLTEGQGRAAVLDMVEFWISRMHYNRQTEQFEIHDVMPPDEYHDNKNNSVYTNSIARTCLQTAMWFDLLLGKTSPKQWSNITDNLYIPFNTHSQYHPEYEGYTPDTVVKQADVIMLNYPMMAEDRGHQVTRNDLNIYEKVTPGGPAMTWAIFITNWLELGNQSQAEHLFQRMIVNAQKPFYIWTENADGSGATNFHTGMGGYLQSLIFGYGGFRLHDQQLTFDPSIPPSITTFSIIGLDYANNSFDFVFNKTNMMVTMTDEISPVAIRVSGVTTKMKLEQSYVYSRGKAALVCLL